METYLRQASESVTPSNTRTPIPGGTPSATASVRKFPYPYLAMLAISTDIDRTTMPVFRDLHRFLNTLEETPMGPGVGLDVADSLWVFKGENNMSDIALFGAHGVTEPEPYADELAFYADVGWIDTLHTYGNYTMQGPAVFKRAHAAIAIRELAARDIRLSTWVNHGSATNTQNIGPRRGQEGDLPDSPAYHSDLMLEYGIRFAWNHTMGLAPGVDEPLSPLTLRDGQRIWGFPRYNSAAGADAIDAFERHPDFYARFAKLRGQSRSGVPATMLWWPALLDCQLAMDRLDRLVAARHYCIAAQHLGDLGGASGLPAAAVETFQNLRRYQDDGLILVARTSRLLEYSRVSQHLRYETRNNGDELHIDVHDVCDPVTGSFVPTLAQLRGVTFCVPDSENARLLINGASVSDDEVVRSSAGDRESTIGFHWFAPDVSDYVARLGPKMTTGNPVDDTDQDTTANDAVVIDSGQPTPDYYVLVEADNTPTNMYHASLEALAWMVDQRSVDVSNGLMPAGVLDEAVIPLSDAEQQTWRDAMANPVWGNSPVAYTERPDTLQPADLEPMGLAHPDRVSYQVTNWAYLPMVFKGLGVSRHDVFVDFGAGKGKMVLEAAMRPFGRVVGVEISPQLSAIALENIELNRSRLVCPRVDIVTSDAAEFLPPADMSVAYFYNPFWGETFQRVLNNILASLNTHPRPLTLVYLLPSMGEAIDATGRFEVLRRERFGPAPNHELVYYLAR